MTHTAPERYLEFDHHDGSFMLPSSEGYTFMIGFRTTNESHVNVPLKFFVTIRCAEGKINVFYTEDAFEIPVVECSSDASSVSINFHNAFNTTTTNNNQEGVMDNSGAVSDHSAMFQGLLPGTREQAAVKLPAGDEEWVQVRLMLHREKTKEARNAAAARAEAIALEAALFRADRARLETVDGPKRYCYLASGPRVTFGRWNKESCTPSDRDIWLMWVDGDEEPWKNRTWRVSRDEFEIIDVGGRLSIRKRNGINPRLNGQPMPRTNIEGQPLKNGDLVSVGIKEHGITPLAVRFGPEPPPPGAGPAFVWLTPSDAAVDGSPVWMVECLMLRTWADFGSDVCPGLLPVAPARAVRLHYDRGGYWLERVDAREEVRMRGEALPLGKRVPLPEEVKIEIGGARLIWHAFASK
ncbi:MAG: hypothetical protein FWG74_04755 [Planctomycetes bacterium]|nr:hypothetical protein [Planctomycetota bacterium]